VNLCAKRIDEIRYLNLVPAVDDPASNEGNPVALNQSKRSV
jgi:hypothetical protein